MRTVPSLGGLVYGRVNLKQRGEPPVPLGKQVLVEPDERERPAKAQSQLGLACLERPGEDGPEVVPFGAEALAPPGLPCAEVLGFRFLG